jgi:hypothetical protein
VYCYCQEANSDKHLTWHNTNCLTINRRDGLRFDGGSKRVISYEICILVGKQETMHNNLPYNKIAYIV